VVNDITLYAKPKLAVREPASHRKTLAKNQMPTAYLLGSSNSAIKNLIQVTVDRY
jgi:hypothetical protein